MMENKNSLSPQQLLTLVTLYLISLMVPILIYIYYLPQILETIFLQKYYWLSLYIFFGFSLFILIICIGILYIGIFKFNNFIKQKVINY